MKKPGQLKTNDKGNIEMTRKEFGAYVKGIADESIMKAMLCVCAYLMEEPEFNFSDERLAALWTGVERYIKTVSEPNTAFNLKKMAKLITEYTGIKVYW